VEIAFRHFDFICCSLRQVRIVSDFRWFAMGETKTIRIRQVLGTTANASEPLEIILSHALKATIRIVALSLSQQRRFEPFNFVVIRQILQPMKP